MNKQELRSLIREELNNVLQQEATGDNAVVYEGKFEIKRDKDDYYFYFNGMKTPIRMTLDLGKAKVRASSGGSMSEFVEHVLRAVKKDIRNVDPTELKLNDKSMSQRYNR